MSLTKCIAKAGAYLQPADKKAILEAARTYRASGLSANEAGIKAVDDILNQAKSQVAELVKASIEAMRAPAPQIAPEPPRAAADKTEAAEKPKAEPAKAPEKIDDIGEKIGSARKPGKRQEDGGTEPMFSRAAKEDPRDLIIQHNLTADNLLFAARMGGLPVPSLAITKAEAPMKNFGEITLLGDVNMADPKQGIKAYGADIYSPRYPRVTYQFTPNMRARAEKQVKAGLDATNTYIDWSEVERDGADELNRQPALMWEFLSSKGITPTIVRVEPKPLDPAIQPFANDTRNSFELAQDPAFQAAAWAAHQEMLTQAYGDAKEAQAEIEKMQQTARERGRSQVVNGYVNGLDQYRRDKAVAGRVDTSATKRAMDAQIHDAGLTDEFRASNRQLMRDLAPNERMFQGYTDSGKRRYKPHTLDNVIAILKKELRGGENFNYGAGSLRAKFTPQFKSVAQIRANKDRLVSNEQFEAIKAEANNDLQMIAESLNKPTDTAIAIMEDAPRMGLGRAAAQYDVDLSDSQREMIGEYMTRLRNMPTEYFEGKLLRAVGIGEFKAAVVPENISDDVLKLLDREGVTVFRYTGNRDGADRARAIQQAAKEIPGLMFSRTPAWRSELRDQPVGMPLAKAQAIVDDLTKKWKNGPPVAVVASPSDLPMNAPDDARGVYWKGKVWIVAGPHKDRADIARTLSHEAVAHYGLRNILSADEWRQYMRNIQLAIKSGNKPLAKIRDQVREAYVDGDGKLYLTEQQEADEIAAKVVEQAIGPDGDFRPGFGFVKSVYAKIVQFLRELGLDVKLTLAEVQGMLVLAQKGLEAGKRTVGQGDVVVAAGRGDQRPMDMRLDESRMGAFAGDPSPEEALSVQSAIEGKTAIEAADFIAQTAPEKQMRVIASRVADQMRRLQDAGMTFALNVAHLGDQTHSQMAGKMRGMTWRAFGSSNVDVFVQGADVTGLVGTSYETVLHELLHAVTQSAIYAGQQAGNTALNKDVQDLQLVHDAIIRHFNQSIAGKTVGELDNYIERIVARGHNALREMDEVVSWGLTNKAMQDYLESIPYKNTTLWGEFVSAIRKFLGLPENAETALSEVLRITDRLLDAPVAQLTTLEMPTQTNYSGGLLNGARTGKDQTDTPEFRNWFGDSVVTDTGKAGGKPLVVYHGTTADLSAFDLSFSGSDGVAYDRPAIFATDDARVASDYARNKRNRNIADAGRTFQRFKNQNPGVYNDEYERLFEAYKSAGRKEGWDIGVGANVLPLYLSIQNPLEVDGGGQRFMQVIPEAVKQASTQDRDGVIVRNVIDHASPASEYPVTVYVAFRPEQIKSVFNRGSYDPADPNIMFSRGTTAEPGREGWDMQAKPELDKLIYELQDGSIDLKRVQEAIKKTGADLEERFDARLAETLYPGRVAKRSENFLKTEVRPLLQAMALLKVDMTELGDYLIARHAPERNAQIAKINPDLPDGGAGRNSEGTLMTDDAAAEYLEAIPADKLRALETLAAKVDAITAGTRNLWVSEGLETPEAVQAMEQAYKHYVPLFKDEAEFSHPQGMGFSVRGAASKRAMGSTKEVTDVLAHVLMAREAAITRAEKNRVGMALYGLALSYPNPDFWTVIRPTMSNTAIAAELSAMGVDPEMMGEGMSKAPTIRTIDPVTNTVVNRPNPAYKNMDNAMVIKVAGEDRVIVFNQRNERAMRMVGNLKNLDGLTKLELANSVIGKATRYIAAVNTQYNPVFGLVNIIRDTQGAVLNLSTTPIADKKRRVLADIPAALTGIARDLRGDERTEWSDLWEQYQEDGGQTGYREMFRAADDRAKAIEKELQSLDKSTPGKMAHAVLDLMDDFNTALENATRLSAYKAALESGLSRKEAARIGKELTVNFNRKGRSGRELNPLYAFMNAAIQGNARILETLKGPMGAKILAGGLMLGAAQALMLAAAGFDDDDIPEWDKARALIIPVDFSSKRYIKIPIALGLNVIPNTGRVLTEIGLNGGKDAGAKVVSAIGEILGAMNPMGGGNVLTADGALKLVAPTVADPIIEVIANRNFAGGRIEREAMENDGRPGYQRARESTLRSATGQVYTGISKALNFASQGSAWEAGSVSPTPEMVRYVARVFGGGLLGEIERVIDAGANLVTGKETKATRIPLTSRFYGEVDPDQVEQRRFYEAARKIQRIERSVKAAKKAGDQDEADRIASENEIYQLAGQLENIQARLRKLNKQATETINNPAEIRDIDEARTDEMKSLNDEVRALEAERYGQTVGSRLRKIAAQP